MEGLNLTGLKHIWDSILLLIECVGVDAVMPQLARGCGGA